MTRLHRHTHDRKIEKRCIHCRKWLLHKYFGKHEASSDGLQSICCKCKGQDNKIARDRNPSARLRHHIATRCLTQLGNLAPKGFTSDLEKYLGYKIKALTKYLKEDLRMREGQDRSLRDAFNEGYHLDHIKPLSLFHVIVTASVADVDVDVDDADVNTLVVDWEVFRECWRMENLSAIPGEDNLKKGARYDA